MVHPFIHRSHTEGRRGNKSHRRGLKSSTELLNMDMIFYGVPSESASSVASTSLSSSLSSRRTDDNDYYRFERDSECGSEAATLPIDELDDEQRSYYNLTSTLPHIVSMIFIYVFFYKVF